MRRKRRRIAKNVSVSNPCPIKETDDPLEKIDAKKYAAGTDNAAITSFPAGTSRKPLFNLPTNHNNTETKTAATTSIIFEKENDNVNAGIKKNGKRAIVITIIHVEIVLKTDLVLICIFTSF